MVLKNWPGGMADVMDTKPKKLSSKILIVEDSKTVSSVLCKQVGETLRFEPVPAYSLAEARSILEDDKDFFVALLDLNLPDAPSGEIVDYVLEKRIPPIILTGTFDETLRDQILAKNVVDYVLKDNAHSLEHVTSLISRIYRNQKITILLVDDSPAFRSYCRRLLEVHKFKVLEANNGLEALDLIEEGPEITLVITDYNMPEMDGFELVTRVRERFGRDEMGIIGLSAQGSGVVSAKFLKMGANDFLPKPFESEEFYARVTQNIEIIELIHELRETAIRDPLTRLYNRRYYFGEGEKHLIEARESDTPVTVAMIDIDRFKEVNDRYGHDAGDEVLVRLADRLVMTFGKSHIVSRFGGEEFSVFAYGLHGQRAARFFDDFRRLIENTEVQYGESTIRFTISIGLSWDEDLELTQLIREADRRLYKAKRDGRNRLVHEE